MFHTRNSEIGNEKSYLVNFDLGHFCYRPCDLFRLKVVVSHFKVCKTPVAAALRSFRFTLLKVERRCHVLFDEKHFSFALSLSSYSARTFCLQFHLVEKCIFFTAFYQGQSRESRWRRLCHRPIRFNLSSFFHETLNFMDAGRWMWRWNTSLTGTRHFSMLLKMGMERMEQTIMMAKYSAAKKFQKLQSF